MKPPRVMAVRRALASLTSLLVSARALGVSLRRGGRQACLPSADAQANFTDGELEALAGNASAELYADMASELRSPPHPLLAAGTAARRSPPRRVFVDLGANWANTLRLYEDISTHAEEQPWEVYAFEASFLIQPYLEEFTAFLNGHGPEPPVTVPPSGSSKHLNQFASRYGCPAGPDTWDQFSNHQWAAMRSCMFRIFKEPLSRLRPDPSLSAPGLVASRLEIAQERPPATAGAARFVALPASAGARDGELHLGMVTAEQMIRGGAISKKIPGFPSMSVPMVNFPAWLAQHFTADDHVVVKMDIEGAEFSTMDLLLRSGNGCLIDVLAVECHANAGNCNNLKWRLQQGHPCIKLLIEDSGYRAWDHYSSPDKYYAADPRG